MADICNGSVSRNWALVDTEFWLQVVNQLPTEAEIRKHKITLLNDTGEEIALWL